MDGPRRSTGEGGVRGAAGRLLGGFLADRRGNYLFMTAVAMIPLMGGLALAVDYTEMNRQRSATMNALDAAGIATARHVVSGADDAALRAYARDFFEANLGPVDPADTVLSVVLPSAAAGGGTLRLSAELNYRPRFLPVFSKLLDNGGQGVERIDYRAQTEIRLKNTLEVALVLDNSGSMDFIGSDSGQKRMTLLKEAAKQLVDTLALQASMIKQVDKPVQFALVPFAASVNVGPQNATASWMDVDGLSPVHHENFDWSTLSEAGKSAQRVDGIWTKVGAGWDAEAGEALTRFTLYKDMKKVDSREWVATGQEWRCIQYWGSVCLHGEMRETGYYEETLGAFASWQGCVEARPYPYNVNDAPPSGGRHNTGLGIGDPATMFVPMFAPDEPGDRWAPAGGGNPQNFGAANNWWNDGPASGTGIARQRNMAKYYETRPYGATSPQGMGPNFSCTTGPITPLTDVTTEEGLATVKGAIDAMAALGGTNVPEGLAWGWRAVSGGEPFAEGRPDEERGNDKVVIVLTDGENTYYTPSSLGYHDPAGNRSTYSSYGYLNPGYAGTGTARLFMGTSGAIGRHNYSNANYTNALNEQMSTLCDNAKAAGVLVMTVSLDLSETNAGERKAIEALRNCASDSRFRKDPNDPGKPAKLFWNANGGNLADKFREIADELSNLRIVG